jgi:hypothetical protein
METNKKSFGTRTNMSASATSLASVIGVDFYYANSSLNSFVSDKSLQLVKAPSVKPKVKPFSFSSLSYVFEFFQHDNPFAVTYNFFADYVIPVSLETSLFARNLFEQFLCTSSAFALESCSQTLELENVTFDFVSAKELSVACYSNMVYSDINPDTMSVRNIVDVDISRECYVKEHLVIFVNGKQSSLPIPVKVFPVILGNIDGDVYSSFCRGELDIFKAKSESSVVKIKRHIFFKDWLRAFAGFNTFKRLGSHSICVYDELGRKIKFVSSFVVTKMMKLVSVANFGFKSFIGNKRNGLRILPHSFKKQLVKRYLNFYSRYGLHNNYEETLSYKPYVKMSSDINGGWQSLPTLKSGVSMPNKL